MKFSLPKLEFEPGTKLFEFLHIKERIQGPGQQTNPKIFRHGDTFIAQAQGNLSPWRFLVWYYLRMILGIFAVLAVVGTGLGWLFGDVSFGMVVLVSLASAIAAFFLLFETDEKIGRLLMGKKTVIEFSEDTITVYKNGYGMSLPRVISRAPGIPVSFLVNTHEKRGKRQTGHNSFTRARYAMYDNAFEIQMVPYGSDEPVMYVYGERWANNFAIGLQRAEKERLQHLSEHYEEKQKEEDVPE